MDQVTDATYSVVVQALLNAQLGPGYTVAPTAAAPATAAGRYTDSAPFYGGDQIFGALQCTGGFNVTGDASHQPLMLTAGHCGANTAWTTSVQVIGPTSGLFWKNAPYYDDFQTIHEPSGSPFVWGNNGIDTVVGSIVPAVGSRVTVDGSVSGEHNYNVVIANNGTLFGIMGPPTNPARYTAAHLVEVRGINLLPICTGGDSGGPMFERRTAPAVDAVGTIVAYYSYDNLPGYACAAERIGTELQRSNASLMVHTP